MFVIAGVLMILVSFLPGLFKFISLMIVIIVMLLVLTVSSYIFFNRYQ
ncbi:hypothetical protein [Halobacillus andaensis]